MTWHHSSPAPQACSWPCFWWPASRNGYSPSVLDAAAVEPSQVTDVMPVARLFGASSASEAGGIRALGVMAEGGTGRGIAVLGVEGKPAKSYRSGDLVAPG